MLGDFDVARPRLPSFQLSRIGNLILHADYE